MSEEIEKYVRDNVPWDELDNEVKMIIGTKTDYDHNILEYSIKNQLRFINNLGESLIFYFICYKLCTRKFIHLSLK